MRGVGVREVCGCVGVCGGVRGGVWVCERCWGERGVGVCGVCGGVRGGVWRCERCWRCGVCEGVGV